MAKKAAKKQGMKRGKRQPPRGQRFKKGQSGNPNGRPPNLGSPRAQLKKYAEEIAPEKIRNAIKKAMPNLDVESLTWAQCVALRHLMKSVEGEMPAIVQSYKQIDDSGIDRSEFAEISVDQWRTLMDAE